MSSDLPEVVVTILNWSDRNPRKDVTKPSWFRYDHDFFEQWEFFDLTHSEIVAWHYLLCQASRRGDGGKTTVNYAHAHRVANLSSTVINSCIEKLKKNRILELRTSRGRHADVIETGLTKRNETLRDETKQDETINLASAVPASPPPPIISDSVPQGEDQVLGGILLGESPPATSPAKPKQPPNKKNIETWESYRSAYAQRYKTDPIRNLTVNSQIANFVRRLGDAAPEVASFYVKHNDAFYVKSLHSVGIMLRDAESLHTQWKRNRAVTGNDVRAFEKQDSFRSQLERIERGEL